MNDKQFNKLVQGLQDVMRCPECKSSYKLDDISYLGQLDTMTFLHLKCSKCKVPVFASIATTDNKGNLKQPNLIKSERTNKILRGDSTWTLDPDDNITRPTPTSYPQKIISTPQTLIDVKLDSIIILKGLERSFKRRRTMTFSYINSKGKTYYLHFKDIKFKNGREMTIYFFAGDIRDNSLEEIPEGYEVFESKRTGLPMLRKKK